MHSERGVARSTPVDAQPPTDFVNAHHRTTGLGDPRSDEEEPWKVAAGGWDRSSSEFTFSDLAGSLETLGDNPLPASYEVRLKPGPISLRK